MLVELGFVTKFNSKELFAYIMYLVWKKGPQIKWQMKQSNPFIIRISLNICQRGSNNSAWPKANVCMAPDTFGFPTYDLDL